MALTRNGIPKLDICFFSPIPRKGYILRYEHLRWVD